MHLYRSHTCDLLSTESAVSQAETGQTVRLSGWCHRIRNHGGILFVDLRDHYGITQCVIDPAVLPRADDLGEEWVIRVEGTVEARPEGTENPKLPTGMVEVKVTSFDVLGPVVGTLPMPVAPVVEKQEDGSLQEIEYPEDIRLKNRFLDLRRERLHENMMKRMEIIRWLRRRMEDEGFFEFQTPILTASSPEGARDFLVPSRLHPGQFYALPQAPQQFKQLTMVAGFDRYFQIAPCFRDEAARADRSPGEFYQLDIEMSFVTQEDVFSVVEPTIRDLFTEFGGCKPVTRSFPRIPYRDAMLRYGTDKPDLRNPLRIADVTKALQVEDMTLEPFKKGVGRAIYVPAIMLAGKSRKWFKDLEGWAQGQGAKGLGYIVLQESELEFGGPLAKFFGPVARASLWDAFDSVAVAKSDMNAGDVIFFAVGPEEATTKFSGLLRTKLGEELDLINKNEFAFCWIVDYPMFEWNAEEKKIDFSHNPFSMPQGGLEALDGDPLQVLAYQYDIVCNGVELSSGAIRNHRPDIMEKAFAIAGYDKAVLEEKFGGMLNAFRCGAPPHGGIAPGIDRMVMLLCEAENLRDVVLFPMNQKGQDLMMGAPSSVTPKQLDELSIRILPRK
jgi:aspartyl-tRNA synthetase